MNNNSCNYRNNSFGIYQMENPRMYYFQMAQPNDPISVVWL